MPEAAFDAGAAPLSDRRRKLQLLSAQPDSVFGLFVRSAAQLTGSEFAAIFCFQVMASTKMQPVKNS